jgi:hypothetical protein
MPFRVRATIVVDGGVAERDALLTGLALDDLPTRSRLPAPIVRRGFGASRGRVRGLHPVDLETAADQRLTDLVRGSRRPISSTDLVDRSRPRISSADLVDRSRPISSTDLDRSRRPISSTDLVDLLGPQLP